MPISPYRTLLARAVALTGGRASFACELGIDNVELHEWLVGVREVPETILDKALDIILREVAHSAPRRSAP